MSQISKQSFIDLMEAVIKQHKKDEELTKSLHNHLLNGHSLVENILASDVVDFLEQVFKTDLISWWLYEDIEKTLYEQASEDNEIKIDLTTIDQLYDYLTKDNRDE